LVPSVLRTAVRLTYEALGHPNWDAPCFPAPASFSLSEAGKKTPSQCENACKSGIYTACLLSPTFLDNSGMQPPHGV